MNRPVRKHLSEANLRLMGIPRELWDKSIDDFSTFNDPDLAEVKRYVKWYIKDFDERLHDIRGIYFCGSNGVGKTMLASIILIEAYRHRYTGSRVTLAEYVRQYTALWNIKDSDQRTYAENEFATKYKNVEFLVLEELGKELDTKVVKPVLEDLLRYRIDNGLVTIYCSNMSVDKVQELYGNSVSSLIKGYSFPIVIDREDKRGAKHGKRKVNKP